MQLVIYNICSYQCNLIINKVYAYQCKKFNIKYVHDNVTNQVRDTCTSMYLVNKGNVHTNATDQVREMCIPMLKLVNIR